MEPAELTFKSWDGTELFYRAWAPKQTTAKALLLFHRGHEHSGRIVHLVDELNLPDYAMFGWDARGHGLSREAEACNPTWTSVPLVGYNFARALAARRDLDVTLVSQVRNRTALLADPIAKLARLHFIDNEWVAAPLYRLIKTTTPDINHCLTASLSTAGMARPACGM